jgi:hypothetical protein
MAVIVVAFTTLNEEAVTAPKLTKVAPVRLVPEIVTVVPVDADAGVKDVMVGAAGIYVNPTFVPVPPDVVTLTDPVAPFATMAVISDGPNIVKEDAGTPPKLTEDVPAKLVPEIVIKVPVAPL